MGTISCNEEDLEPTLEQQKDVETSIQTAEDLQGVLAGAFNRMTSTNYYGRSVIVYGEVRSDNCYANGKSGRYLTSASMDMLETNANATDTWTQIYAAIASANIVISKSDAGIEGDQNAINQVIGQAYVIRALAHFDLLRLYGQQHVTGRTTEGIPYITEYKGEEVAPARKTVSEVKDLIYADIASAISLLYTVVSADNGNDSKEFITAYAAHALKARVAVYFADWAAAKTACEAVINSSYYSIMPAASYINSWTAKQNSNSIFELAYSSVDNANIDGIQQIYRGSSYGDVRALDNLYNIFEATDVRRAGIGYDPAAPTYLTNLAKYPATDYSDNIPVFRYEEVILNYAEALFGLSDANALTWLNKIPAERGASAYSAISKDNILLERRKELCFEGFRFDDLARTGQNIPVVDALKQSHGGPAYGSYKYALPIPKVELNANPNMTQNEGY